MPTNDPQRQQPEPSKKLRQLPSIEELKSSQRGEGLEHIYGPSALVQAIRAVEEQARRSILEGQATQIDSDTLITRAELWLADYFAYSLKPVINATGVIIHTNLGRSPVSDLALEAMRQVGGQYSSLEFDLESGKRGSRSTHGARLLSALTGAEESLVVNNNAAAVLLMLTALCRDREVIISRGQMVEIGGGFRIPDVLNQSGASLVEVGTTNRTNINDYKNAIGEKSAAILVAHHSNFKIVGFTQEPQLSELASLAHEHGLLFLLDQGSGAIIDTKIYGLDHEPTVNEALEQGADLVCFSGDKLLGGPQAGIICGSAVHIDKLKQHPLARAVRADKFTLAALEATLLPYLKDRKEKDLPVWRMIACPLEEIEARAMEICRQLVNAGVSAEVVTGESTIGGGSLPGSTLPTKLIAVQHRDLNEIAHFLRLNDPAIVARIANDRLLCDPRTVMAEQDQALVSAIINANNENN